VGRKLVFRTYVFFLKRQVWLIFLSITLPTLCTFFSSYFVMHVPKSVVKVLLNQMLLPLSRFQLTILIQNFRPSVQTHIKALLHSDLYSYLKRRSYYNGDSKYKKKAKLKVCLDWPF
jgi:hypothetical protein